jgi:hypothetical protein
VLRIKPPPVSSVHLTEARIIIAIIPPYLAIHHPISQPLSPFCATSIMPAHIQYHSHVYVLNFHIGQSAKVTEVVVFTPLFDPRRFLSGSLNGFSGVAESPIPFKEGLLGEFGVA